MQVCPLKLRFTNRNRKSTVNRLRLKLQHHPRRRRVFRKVHHRPRKSFHLRGGNFLLSTSKRSRILLHRHLKRRFLSPCPLLDKRTYPYSRLQCLTIIATANLRQISGRLLLCMSVYLQDLAMVLQPIQMHLHSMPTRLGTNDFLQVPLGLCQRLSVMADGVVHPTTDMQTLPDGVSLQIITIIIIRHHPNLIIVGVIITPLPHRYQFLEVPDRSVGSILMCTFILRLARDNHLYHHVRFRHLRNWAENDLERVIGKLTVPTPVAEKTMLTILEMIDVHPLLQEHWTPGGLIKNQYLNGEMYLAGQEEIVIAQRMPLLLEWKTTHRTIIRLRVMKTPHPCLNNGIMILFLFLKNINRMQTHLRNHY